MLAKNSTALGLECLAKQEWPKTPLATAPHDKSCPDFGLNKRTCVAPAAIKFDLVLTLTKKKRNVSNQFLIGLKIDIIAYLNVPKTKTWALEGLWVKLVGLN